jgi:hypothetical protein
MAKLPDWIPNLVPEGPYRFKVTEEPEVRKTNENKWLIIKMIIMDSSGNSRKYSDVFFPGEEKYRSLLLVAGAKPDVKGIPHLKDMDTAELVDVEFNAEIVHEPDRKDPEKIRDIIRNIIVPDPTQALREEKEEVEEDIPMDKKEEDKIPF